MGKRVVFALALAASFASHASAQSGEFDDSVIEAPSTTQAPPETSVEASVEETLQEASEPVEEASMAPPPGYAVPHPPRPRQVHDEERAPIASAPVTPEPTPDVELAITINGLLTFSGTTTPVLLTAADLVFSLDPHLWIGLGITFSYAEQHSGTPDMKFVTSAIAVPLVLQYYFEAPHVGAAVPTLRVHVTPGWSETPVGSSIPSTQMVTGSAALLAGITWMATSWLALRIIGGIQGGFGVNVVGPVSITGNAGVQALVSAVIRF